MSTFIPDPSPVYTPEWRKHPDAELIVFCGRDMLLRSDNDQYEFPRTAELEYLNISSALSIGLRNGRPCYAVDLAELPEPPPEPVQ